MSTTLLEKVAVWLNVYRRIRFFRKMYPLSNIAKDLVLFPLDYRRDDNRINSVRNVTLAITHRCNIRCSMCYFKDELGDKKELSLETYRKVVDATAPSRPCIILSGGEPLTHKGILQMVSYAKGKGLPVQIFTNGTLVTPRMCEKLTEAGLDYIDFTLLGDQDTHSLVANSPGAYEKLLNNLEYFAGNRGRTKVVLNFTITPQGLAHLRHAVELAQRLDLDGLRIQHYNFLTPGEFQAQERVMSRLFGSDSTTHEISNQDDFAGVADEIISFQKWLVREGIRVPVQWAPTLSESELRNWYSREKFHTTRRCLYPWRGILIDADGKIYPCSKIYLELGDLGEEDALDIWNNQKMLTFRKQLKKGLFPACSRCCKL